MSINSYFPVDKELGINKNSINKFEDFINHFALLSKKWVRPYT